MTITIEDIGAELATVGFKISEESSLSELDGCGVAVIRLSDNIEVDDYSDLPMPVIGLAEKYCTLIGIHCD